MVSALRAKAAAGILKDSSVATIRDRLPTPENRASTLNGTFFGVQTAGIPGFRSDTVGDSLLNCRKFLSRTSSRMVVTREVDEGV